jgi:hypothetical protein
MAMTALDFALDYAARGWHVHPCRPQDKRPDLRGWQERSATDLDQIRARWSAYPDATIEIAAAAETGLSSWTWITRAPAASRTAR